MENNQIHINTEEVVEIPLSEYEAIKALAASMAEQNTTILQAIAGLTAATLQLVEAVTASARQTPIVIPAPVVTVDVQPTPIEVTAKNDITVQPAEVNLPKPVREKQTVKRDKDGNIASTDTTIEYKE